MSTTRKSSSASAAEMAAEKAEAPTTPPKNAPTLRPVGSLSRRARAEFFAPLKDVPLDANGELSVPVGGALAEGAAGYAMLAAIEDSLRILAIDEQAFDEWALKAPDADLMQLFGFVFNTMQPGEAQASPN